MILQDRVAVITGGRRGIGWATALKMAAEGAVVVVGDLSVEDREELTLCGAEGERIYEGALNVAEADSVKLFFEKVVNQFKRVDILINNAGICRPVIPFEEVSEDSWRQMFEVNTMGIVRCSDAVIPIMKEQGGGKIVNSTSLAGQVGGIRVEASYAASKAANICLTKSLAKYLGPYQITVNAVSPGFIATEMSKNLTNDCSGVPLRREGTAEEVADAVLFLASGQSSYITGVVLDINGGVHMG